MVFKYFKTFSYDSLAAGMSYSDTWDMDEDLVIKRIHIYEKTGASLKKSTFYLKIKDRVYTLAVAPAYVFDPSVVKALEFDISAAKGEKLAFTFANNEGAAVSVFISFECWSP
jgi:hypothetical protein